MGCRGLFVTAVFNCENKNLGIFATFLRLGTLFRLCKTETGYRAVAHLRFCTADLRLDALRQSLIAKKLQPRPVFCFCAFGMGSRWRGTGARGVDDTRERKQRYRWGRSGVVRGVASSPLSPPFAPKASEWGCFSQNRRFDVAIYGEDVDERKVDGKNPPPSPTVYKTDT